jgi:ribose transport system permease protein
MNGGSGAAVTGLPPAPAETGSPRLDMTRLRRYYDLAFPLGLLLIMLIVHLVAQRSGFGLTEQLATAAPLIIAAMASAPAVMGGGLDLSISPLIFFVNAVFVSWLAPAGLDGAAAIPLMLLVGLAVGTFTGLLVVLLRVDAIVATLAMYFALQGIDLWVAPKPESVDVGWLAHLAGSVGPIPGGLFTIAAPLVIWWALKRTPFPNYLYAIGSNAETAYSSGVDVPKVRVMGYALGGLFAGVAGIALTALVQSTTAANATEYTLPAIAGVTLGGISLAGGRGRLIGAAFGAGALYLLQDLLASLQVNAAYLQLVYGVVLILAVILSGIVSGDRARGISALPRLRRRGAEARKDPSAALSLDIAEADDGEAALRPPSVWGRVAGLQKRFPIAQCVVTVAIFAYGAATLDGFGSWPTIKLILLLAALVGLASVGQTLLILMGGFDMSVSGFIVFGALATTALAEKYDLSFGLMLVLAVIAAAILGAIAGQICHRFRIQPLITTLAMGAIAVGAVQVQMTTLTGIPPTWVSKVAQASTKTLGVDIPPTVVIWAIVALFLAFVLHRTVSGRHLMATGANPRAAEYALISTRRIWTIGFAVSAAMSVLVGVLIAGYGGGVTGEMGNPYLFQSVVAVVVGGTIFGGPGDYTRTCIGALLLTVLTTVLVGHGATTATEDVVYGVVILAAIAAYGRRGRLADSI